MKTNSSWIKDLNLRHKAIKLLEENKGEKHWGLRLGQDLDMTTKSKSILKKINWTSSKCKVYDLQKDTACKDKYYLGEIFAKHIW